MVRAAVVELAAEKGEGVGEEVREGEGEKGKRGRGKGKGRRVPVLRLLATPIL